MPPKSEWHASCNTRIHTANWQYEHRKHSKRAGTGLGTVIIRIWHLG
jgi:hypothetical protein